MKKKPSRKSLIKALDTLVSKIVRARDKACVQCLTTQNLTCGHLFSRVNYATRWDLSNCFCQCIGCNLRHEYDPYLFFNWYINKFGKESLDALSLKHHQLTHFKDFHLQVMLEEYTVILKDLETVKSVIGGTITPIDEDTQNNEF